MSRFKWYRKLRGGFWFFTYGAEWQKVSETQYNRKFVERMGRPAWSLEDHAANG